MVSYLHMISCCVSIVLRPHPISCHIIKLGLVQLLRRNRRENNLTSVPTMGYPRYLSASIRPWPPAHEAPCSPLVPHAHAGLTPQEHTLSPARVFGCIPDACTPVVYPCRACFHMKGYLSVLWTSATAVVAMRLQLPRSQPRPHRPRCRLLRPYQAPLMYCFPMSRASRLAMPGLRKWMSRSSRLRLTALRLRKRVSPRKQSMSDPQLLRFRIYCFRPYNRSSVHSTNFFLHNSTRPRYPTCLRTVSTHQRRIHVKHRATYLFVVANVPKAVWTLPQRVCTALS
jgi:hypothetical protein